MSLRLTPHLLQTRRAKAPKLGRGDAPARAHVKDGVQGGAARGQQLRVRVRSLDGHETDATRCSTCVGAASVGALTALQTGAESGIMLRAEGTANVRWEADGAAYAQS